MEGAGKISVTLIILFFECQLLFNKYYIVIFIKWKVLAKISVTLIILFFECQLLFTLWCTK